jgi:hypothetical protein
MLLLDTTGKVFRVRYGHRPTQNGQKPLGLVVADLVADVSFFIGFIVYPSTSTAIFMFL